MTNESITAKNTFAYGLVMDFAPDNTQANCLTSALNATLLTFNGNEMSLQNDMGNGRVETARLPEGYIPVGSCEFGGIIYIVSYNPIQNKSLIGCFPSPERNISSKELGAPNVSISSSDFQEMITINHLEKPSGKLKNTTIKKLLTLNKLNPGDKFLICSEINNISTNINHISHINGDKNYKFINIRVVSIDDSGKLNYVDSDLVQYQLNGEGKYFIKELAKNNDLITDNIDLDSYRITTSDWQIFQSKSSGKLALLIELEKIDNFICNWLVYNIGKSENYDRYAIYLVSKWESDKHLNPACMVLTKSVLSFSEQLEFPPLLSTNIQEYKYNNATFNSAWYTRFTNKPDSEEFPLDALNIKFDNSLPDIKSISYIQLIGHSETIHRSELNNDRLTLQECCYIDANGEICYRPDTFIVNQLKDYVIKKFGEVDVPKKEKQIGDDIIYSYEITPAMEYGLISELASSGSINLSKLSDGLIKINQWRYYNSDDNCNLKFELHALPELNYKIDSVTFDFYDNDGLAAKYRLQKQKTYSGQRTITLGFNKNVVDSNFITKENDNILYHFGQELDINLNLKKYNNIVYKNTINDSIEFEQPDDVTNYKAYVNDFNLLYKNWIYLVKITVKQSSESGNILKEDKTFYRWLWTSKVFNEKFSTVSDFNDEYLDLEYDCNMYFKTNDNFKFKIDTVNNLENTAEESLSWSEQSLDGTNDNFEICVTAGLQNNYDCLYLQIDDLTPITPRQQIVDPSTPLDTGTGLVNPDDILTDRNYANNIPIKLYFGQKYITNDSDLIPRFSELQQAVNANDILPTSSEWNSDVVDNSIPNDRFNISALMEQISDPITYINKDGDEYSAIKYISYTLSNFIDDRKNNKFVPLRIDLKQYTKIKHCGNTLLTKSVPVYKPIIDSEEDANYYNIGITNEGKIYFKKGLAFGYYKVNNNTRALTYTPLYSDEHGRLFATMDDSNNTVNIKNDSLLNCKNSIYYDLFSKEMNELNLFFPMYYGGKANSDDVHETKSPAAHKGDYMSTSNYLTLNFNSCGYPFTKFYSGNSFDIKGSGQLSNYRVGSNQNILCLLGINDNNIPKSIASGMFDGATDNKFFTLIRENVDGLNRLKFTNMAVPIFYVLTQLYHRQNLDTNKDINVKNYISLNPYNVNYSLDLILHIGTENGTEYRNLLIREKGSELNELAKLYSLNNIITLTKHHIGINSDINLNNITSKILLCHKTFPLTLQIPSYQFTVQNPKAYYKIRGMYYPCQEIINDKFYYISNVYNEKYLRIYDGKEQAFINSELNQNIKYVKNISSDLIPEQFQGGVKLQIPGELNLESQVLSDTLNRLFINMLYNKVNSNDDDKNNYDQTKGFIGSALTTVSLNLRNQIEGLYSNELINNYFSWVDPLGNHINNPTQYPNKPDDTDYYIIEKTESNGTFYFIKFKPKLIYIEQSNEEKKVFNFGLNFNKYFIFDGRLTLNPNKLHATWSLENNSNGKQDNENTQLNTGISGFIRDLSISDGFDLFA